MINVLLGTLTGIVTIVIGGIGCIFILWVYYMVFGGGLAEGLLP